MKGKIVDISGDEVLVEVDETFKEKNVKCFNRNGLKCVLAKNNKCKEIGETVELSIVKDDKGVVVWFVYMMPIVLLVLGAMIGMIFKNELYIFLMETVFFIIGLVLSYIISKVIYKKSGEVLVASTVKGDNNGSN